MDEPVALAVAAEKILSEAAPLALLDTCSLLDILRAPVRKNIPNSVIAAAQILKTRADASPKQAWLVAADPIRLEWQNRFASVKREFSDHVSRVDSSVAELHSAALTIHSRTPSLGVVQGSRGDLRTTPPEYGTLNLPEQLVEIAVSILESTLWVSVPVDCILKARERSAQAKKPAQMGRESRVDCEIIETYFALCDLLVAESFGLDRLFVSSNERDFFSQASKSKHHEDFSDECARTGIRFVRNLSQTVSELFGRATLQSR
jgi:hypothetical protein